MRKRELRKMVLMGKSGGMNTRRIFAGVSVEATEALRAGLAELQRELRGERIRWTRMENLHLTVVAEGVETEAQRELLKAHHCPVIQGYLFSRPLAPADIPNWIKNAADAPVRG